MMHFRSSLPVLSRAKRFKVTVLGAGAVLSVACGGAAPGSEEENGPGAGSGGVTGQGVGGTTTSGGTGGGDLATGGTTDPGVGGGAMTGGSTGDGGSVGTGGASGLPEKIVGGYWANWPESQIRLIDVPESYNLIYLFAAKPVGGAPGTTGAVEWTPPGNGRGAATNFVADLAEVRSVQGRTVILSVGGAGAGMSFPTREKSQTFVDSIETLYEQFGGFDGLDWNTFEADQAPDTEEMIWISLELKSKYPGFLISAPPAPWNTLDQDFCEEMIEAGAMDYAAPQYYDGPGLATEEYLATNVAQWVNFVGAEHLVIGFGIWDQTNYWPVNSAISGYNAAIAAHPGLRGVFNWAIHIDEGQGWPFADDLGPVVAP